MRSVGLIGLSFEQAGKAWLESRKPYLASKTIHEYELNLRTLSAFFAEMKLEELTADQIRMYQRVRLKTCGAPTINHECGVLQQMLKRIGRWQEIGPDYQPLPPAKTECGRALRDEERTRLLKLAASQPHWQGAYSFMAISINTTAGPKETMTLRLKDVDVEERIMFVQPEGAKNVHRPRRIPLNEEALAAVKMALKRARLLGCCDPDHYLFPFRVNKGDIYDPTRHQTTFKTAWRTLVKKAAIPQFRAYDLRHHAITALLENPRVSEQTAEDIAGHISARMKKRYSHIRIEAKRQAVESIAPIAANKKPPHSERRESGRARAARQLLAALTKLLQ